MILRVVFEWDLRKEQLNLTKHGVGFAEAQAAFLDPLRVIAVDEGHSRKEPRLFCIGRSYRGIVTAAFYATRRSHSDNRSRVLAQRQAPL